MTAAMGGTYSFVRTASANLRETNDTYNTALGGFFAGSILGLRGAYFIVVSQLMVRDAGC